MSCYLESSPLIDVEHPGIQAYVAAYGPMGRSDVEIARDTFEFVRDQVRHSWDIGSRQVTAKASDVLRHREGICYAKSHLLAALLRGMGVPSGLCYQRLTLGDTPDAGHCIHALNTAYLRSLGRWTRLDARGNKPGVDAQFSLDREQLAFAVREDCGEREYWVNHPEPHPKIVETLTTNDDCRVMCARRLPVEL